MDGGIIIPTSAIISQQVSLANQAQHQLRMA